MLKKIILPILLLSGILFAFDAAKTGIVNFAMCIQDSKYGKNEQAQLENIRKQWMGLMEETEKELKEVSAKLEDKDYIEGLSNEAEEDLKAKYRNLNEDLSKYQNQLYQVLNQANYFFINKMSSYITKASEQIAKRHGLKMIINKEACFFATSDLDLTKPIISEMDKNYESDMKNKKLSEKENTNKKENVTANES